LETSPRSDPRETTQNSQELCLQASRNPSSLPPPTSFQLTRCGRLRIGRLVLSSMPCSPLCVVAFCTTITLGGITSLAVLFLTKRTYCSDLFPLSSSFGCRLVLVRSKLLLKGQSRILIYCSQLSQDSVYNTAETAEQKRVRT